MRSRNYHQNEVKHYLAKYLLEATQKIHLAIGWLNDEGILALLQKKAIAGVEVILILIEEEDIQKTVLEKVQKGNYRGVQVLTLEERYRERMIDHKFGVIDESIILTGSYDWGLSGSKEDAITITKKIPSLAQGFEVEFDRLSKIKPNSKKTKKVVNPTIELLKKLEVIKTLLGIGDTDFLYLRLRGLKKYLADENVALIHDTLRRKAYEEAIPLIKDFIRYHQYFQECIEPPIDNFRREIQLLEDEIANISNEYSETEKLIHQFSLDHTASLGDLLQKILFQSKIKAEIEHNIGEGDQKTFEEAKNDYESYTKTHEASKKQKQKKLSRQEQKELKKIYRQSSLRCHPDKVVEELHAQAEEIFIELNEAYKANDLERLRTISEQLKTGHMLSKSEGITTLKKLESSFNTLNQKLKDWQEKLANLQQMPSYKTISSIDDWEVYFEETRVVLEAQLKRLLKFNETHLKPTA